ncbi:MAG: histidinol-phosphate transaminase, partial [Brevundimonas sp.]
LNTKGIIVRPVGGYGLPQALRITIGTEDQNRAVIDALSEFAAS